MTSADRPAAGTGLPQPTVSIRAAATVMVVRDAPGGDGLEVCLLRRNLQSAFVGGAYLFPGGAVDGADGAPDVAALCAGRTQAQASAALGVDTGGLAFWVAAVRETFEECGLLLARRASDGCPVAFADAGWVERFAEHRRAVDAGERRLAEILAAEGLQFDLTAMHYVAHWVTPAGAPRRYDTRFFLAAAPAGQEPLHDDREVISAAWLRPAAALAEHAAGAFSMLPPTVESLRWLAGFPDASAALAGAAAIRQVPMILPRVLTALDGSVTIVRPGDDGYDDAHTGDESLPRWRP